MFGNELDAVGELPKSRKDAKLVQDPAVRRWTAKTDRLLLVVDTAGLLPYRTMRSLARQNYFQLLSAILLP
jgi:hypothetical protein